MVTLTFPRLTCPRVLLGGTLLLLLLRDCERLKVRGDGVTAAPEKFRVWGPGLRSEVAVPYRYFFIQAVDTRGKNMTEALSEEPRVYFVNEDGSPASVARVSVYDRNNGSYIVSYRVMSAVHGMGVEVLWRGGHVANSPYLLQETVYHENCACPEVEFSVWSEQMECPASYAQIDADLETFPKVNMTKVKPEMLRRFIEGKSRSTSLVRYVIKDNQLYRQTYGEYVGFKMFSDAFLLSLMRKIRLPDAELFINLGDYPLEKGRAGAPGASPGVSPGAGGQGERATLLPIFSWCGSEDTTDIVMPTYKVTESTLSGTGMTGTSATLLSVQGNTGPVWGEKESRAFWRGRDARRERLELIRLARGHSDVIDAELTYLFFFRHEEDITAETLVKPTNFYDFFKHKYQINMDGTVAAYRLPHLLAGDSLVLKQQSNFYEHYYRDLRAHEHYLPFRRDLSDLLEKLTWARENDERARAIAQNAQNFVNDNLLPAHIYCYYAILLNKYAERLTSRVIVDEELELVEQPKARCACENKYKQREKTEL